MEKEQIDFLKKLIDTPTPTGLESAGALLLGRRIKELTGLNASIDVHGNLHAVLDAGAPLTVMIEGHGDEIGYMVEYIDERGYVYLQPIGGVVAPLTAAERLTILSAKGPVNAVVGTRPPHLMKPDEKKSVAADDLRLMPCDIGAASREEALSLVAPGDSAVVDSGFRKLAGTRFSGRGLDDRIGTFAMCETFIRLATDAKKPRVNVHYVSSVCEEIGLVGGRLASYAVNPAIGICCDVTFAESPLGDDYKTGGDVRIGGGAAIARGPIYHKGLYERVMETAKSIGAKTQVRPTPKGAGNNGWAMKLERGGAAVCNIAIPIKYMHSPVEVADFEDIDSVVDVASATIASLDAGFNLLPEQP